MSPSLELQQLLYSTLHDDFAISSLVNGVYDIVQPGAFAEPKLAYISFGPHDYVPDDADCIIGGEHTFQIDVWSRGIGYPKCKEIADLVKAKLHESNIELPINALASITVDSVRFLRDADGLTSRSIITVRALVEET